MAAHAELIRLWSPESAELFDHVADLVPVPTTRGPLTMPDFLALTRGAIHIIREDDEVHLAALLLEAQGRVAIDGRYVGVDGFVRTYAARRCTSEIHFVRSDVAGLFARVQDPEGTWSALLAAFEDLGVEVSLAAFAPVEVPAIQVNPELARQMGRAGRALAEGHIPAGVLALFKGACDEQARRPEARPHLHLNARCALMQRLRESVGDCATLRPLLEIVVAAGRILSGRPLTGQDALQAVGRLTAAVGTLAGAKLPASIVHPLDLVLEGCPRERAAAVSTRWPRWPALAAAPVVDVAAEAAVSHEKAAGLIEAARRR